MRNHDCTHHCNPDTCKVQAQERFADGQDVMDDGLPAKCCGMCRHYTASNDDPKAGYCAEDDAPALFMESCLAWERREA